VADFGLTRDIYATEYYRANDHTRLPVKWMSPESLLDHFFDGKTDVVCFIYSYLYAYIQTSSLSTVVLNSTEWLEK